ncbi:hypothetical protein Ahy_B10g101942 [Arachis hypogaea]|uniref:Aminotransferase-like plant mobile domain-containing protein n=1 Tax=Arachis hypogaea TaxID=3818 RepID=A0A444X0S8_ARAHY|nr:hypothetical protein Ahy_B10g101942 [Arachis hypogaea]
MRRQHGMLLDDRIVLYLQMAGLYHLARLNETWFRLDEPLVSAFVERWPPKMHTFHMPFRKCMIKLQDITYQLRLPIDGQYVRDASRTLRDASTVVALCGHGSRRYWFVWIPYSLSDVVQVVHPEILEPRYMVLWRALIILIYFAVIKWHQVDQVLPQLGGSSHAYLECWHEYDRRFLLPKLLFGDPKAVVIPAKAMQQGPRHVPYMNQVLMSQTYVVLSGDVVLGHIRVSVKGGVVGGEGRGLAAVEELEAVVEVEPDVEREVMVAMKTRVVMVEMMGVTTVMREVMVEDTTVVTEVVAVVDMIDPTVVTEVVTRAMVVEVMVVRVGVVEVVRMVVMVEEVKARVVKVRQVGREMYMVAMMYMVEVKHVAMCDVAMHESQKCISLGQMLLNLLGSEGLDTDFGESRFLDEISMIMQEDDLARRRSQVDGSQAHLDVNLNEPLTGLVDDTFALGGTPPSSFATPTLAHPGPSTSQEHIPDEMELDRDGDGQADEVPLTQRA